MGFEDIDNRTDHNQFSLLGQQLLYLTKGEIGTSRPGKLESKIRKKHSLLGDRLQYLIEDLAFMHTADCIDPDDWEQTWEQMEEMSSKNRVYSSPKAVEGILPDVVPFYEFGIQLGHLARFLSKESKSESKEVDIAQGFLIGMSGGFLSTDFIEENSFDIDKGSDQNIIEYTKHLRGPSSELHSTLEELQESTVKSQGSSPKSYQDYEITLKLMEQNLSPYPPLREAVKRRIHEDESDSFHPDLKIAPVISDIKDDDRIKQIKELSDAIIEDLELLANKKAGRKDYPIFAGEVLNAVCSQRKPNDSKITEYINEGRRDDPSGQKIAKIRNDLGGVGTDSRHWEDYPLIGEKTGNYYVTDFGKLVGILIAPGSTDRDFDKYLPVPEDADDSYCIPEAAEVRTACYAFAFGVPNETRQKVFEKAYEDRIGN